MNYLKQVNISQEKIEELKITLSEEIINNLIIARHNVIEVLMFLKDYGVQDLYNILKYRPDLCLKDKNDLEKDLTVFDKELLLFIFNNSLDDLINFNI
ncbi:MAG: hypothetical protein PHG03_03540 [Bacilli bacterium]|nr:hypothetical protein [Bacilli bacterium]MDD4795614.1 hypothetical protein [Bacilli bacterium]